MHGQQPVLQAVSKKQEALGPYLNSEGQEVVTTQVNALVTHWQDLQQDITQRLKELQAAVQARRDMYGRWDELSRWLSKAMKKLESTNEVYSDEVSDAQSKLQTLLEESQSKAGDVDHLTAEVQQLCTACPNTEEASALEEKFENFRSSYERLHTRSCDRVTLCQKWTEFLDTQKQVSSQLKTAQHKLESGEFDQEQINRIKDEVSQLLAAIEQWQPQVQEILELMDKSEMTIKDRGSRRPLVLDVEISTLISQCEQVTSQLEGKQQSLDELNKQWQEFDANKSDLLKRVEAVKQRLEAVTPTEVSLPAVKACIAELKACDQTLQELRAESDQLHNFGRQLMMVDSSHMVAVQEGFTAVEAALESTQTSISERLQSHSTIATLWQQYNDSKTAIHRVLSDTQPVLDTPLVFNDQPEVKDTLQKHKVFCYNSFHLSGLSK